MKRKIYESLKYWKNNSNGDSAIFIDGARRVGKNYTVDQFAKNEYRSYITIDFSNISPKVIDVFENDSHDLVYNLKRATIEFGVKEILARI